MEASGYASGININGGMAAGEMAMYTIAAVVIILALVCGYLKKKKAA